jgi:hypothetical protein
MKTVIKPVSQLPSIADPLGEAIVMAIRPSIADQIGV